MCGVDAQSYLLPDHSIILVVGIVRIAELAFIVITKLMS